MDFQGPYSNNKYFYYDRPLKSFARSICLQEPSEYTNAMKAIFANRGTPETCHSDNGPLFQSDAPKKFAKEEGFRHKHITPEWQRANGTVERSIRSKKEAVQAETTVYPLEMR